MLEKYAALSPSNKRPMSLRFAFSSVPHAIASFFGSGVLRPASGTWGTLAGLLAYLALHPLFSPLSWMGIVIGTFIVGAWASGITGADIGVHDHSSIVIDEVFAIWMILPCVPDTLGWQVGAFVAFRFFDIVKIQPARWFDTSPRWHNGMGVMLDDFVAGVQALVVLGILQYFA